MKRLWPFGVLGVLACQDALLPSPSVDRIVLSADSVALAPEEHGRITFVSLAEDGSYVLPRDTAWESRNEGVVTVDPVGSLLAIAGGTTYVVLRAGGVSDSVRVVVQRDWRAVPSSGNWCRLQGNDMLRCAALLRTPPAGTFAVWGLGQTGTQCVIATGGVIHCRGSNYAGALGDGSPMDPSSTNVTRDAFAPVSGPGGYDQLIGYYGLTFCGRRSGEVRCWGYDDNGSVGNDTSRTAVGTPTPVAGGLVFTSLAEEVDAPELCGTASGRLWCWGGFGTSPALRIPHAVTADLGLVRASRGYDHTCALDGSGAAWCWGYNNDGQLGRGSFGPDWVFDSVPAPVTTDLRFLDILVYFNYTCGVSLAGEIWCWGRGSVGQLGAPGIVRSNVPIKVPSLERYVTVHQGYSSGACALTTGGAEYCWGGVTVNLDTKPEDYLPRRTPPPY